MKKYASVIIKLILSLVSLALIGAVAAAVIINRDDLTPQNVAHTLFPNRVKIETADTFYYSANDDAMFASLGGGFAVFGLAENLTIQTVGMALCNILMPSAAIPVLGMQISVQLFAIPAMVFIALYSGRKLLKSKALQWGFYLFYPVHIMFLWGLLQFLR